MYVQDTNAPTFNLRVPGMSEEYQDGVDIPESDDVEGGIAQVDQQTGEALIEQCPPITEYNE